MTITATEYQQNVGYYFGLAEQGNTIIIKRTRPKEQKFKLQIVKKTRRKKKSLANLAMPFLTSGIKESGLDLQKRVRS